mgnify:CR=1 FL=1
MRRRPVVAIAAALALFSATQDMAVDAYRTELLPAAERGLGAAYYVTGYRSAMLVSGGLALILAGSFLGWKGTFLLMAGLMVVAAAAAVLLAVVQVVFVRGIAEPSVIPWVLRNRLIIVVYRYHL